MTTQLQNQASTQTIIPAKQAKFSAMLKTDGYQSLIAQTLQEPARRSRFIANISAAVATNPALQTCDAGTILSAALLGESLNLSPSPQLGHFYMVPFQDNKRGRTVATFVLGYKGYVQLALRSGVYRRLNVVEIREPEFVSWKPLTEELQANMSEDDAERDSMPVHGYYVMFEYLNGFTKAMYWRKSKMLAHAGRYSKAFKVAEYDRFVNGEVPASEQWKFSSFWYKDFDGMAMKTMLRQIISKWGIMSAELRNAFERDETIAEPGKEPTGLFEAEDTAEEVSAEKADAVVVVDDAGVRRVVPGGVDAQPEPAKPEVKKELF